MNKEEIYQLLNKNNINATMIATSLEVTPQAVHKVISDGRGSRRIAEAVALMCNKSLVEVFPHFKGVPTKEDIAEKQKLVDQKLAKFA